MQVDCLHVSSWGNIRRDLDAKLVDFPGFDRFNGSNKGSAVGFHLCNTKRSVVIIYDGHGALRALTFEYAEEDRRIRNDINGRFHDPLEGQSYIRLSGLIETDDRFGLHLPFPMGCVPLNRDTSFASRGNNGIKFCFHSWL